MASLHVEIDRSLCAGHARCVAHAPEVFEFGDDDRGHVRQSEITDPEALEVARRAVAACPERAIVIEERP